MNWKNIHFGMLFTACLMLSCGNNTKAKNENENQGNNQHSPVETKSPNADYQPAFPEQTRAPGIKTETSVQMDIIANDIGKPWSIKQLPDSRLLITDKSGIMQIFTENGELVSKITGFPKVVDKGQGGLLDVELDPSFEQNKMIFWTYSEPYEKGNLTAVAKGKLSEDEKSIENVQVIFRAEPAYDGNLHFGSRLVFDKDGFLFVSTGERSDLETRPQAQELNSGLGKIFRIDKDGRAAPGNPFASQDNAKPEIFTYGHRNPQGLAFHPQTGVLWSSEFGPLGGDEVNIIEAGKNYGWGTITYGLEYSGKKVGEGITKMEGMEQPIYYWDPVVSPSGICFYNGNKIPEWKNNLFLACLSGQHILRLKIEGNRVVGEERLLESENERFRDVISGKGGVLYAITDSGKIYKLEKGI